MTTVLAALRARLAAADSRRAAAHRATVTFCDGCARVGDAATRARTRYRQEQTAAHWLPR